MRAEKEGPAKAGVAGLLIPTRRVVSAQQAGQVAKVLVDGLLAGWGLANTKKIVAAMSAAVKAEYKRRREHDE